MRITQITTSETVRVDILFTLFVDIASFGLYKNLIKPRFALRFMEKVIFSDKGNEYCVECKRVSFLGRMFGLMFKSRNTHNLIFDFNRSVKLSFHSYFVFFSFLIIFLDGNNKVLYKKTVEPFTLGIKPREEYSRVIEIPLNLKNKTIIELLVGKKKGLNI